MRLIGGGRQAQSFVLSSVEALIKKNYKQINNHGHTGIVFLLSRNLDKGRSPKRTDDPWSVLQNPLEEAARKNIEIGPGLWAENLVGWGGFLTKTKPLC